MVKYKTGDDFSGGKFLDVPGDYHMIVNDCQWPAMKEGSEDLKNLFAMNCEVLAGPSGTIGKEKRLIFKKPKASDNTNFKQKLIDRTLIALALVDPTEKNKEVEFNEDDFKGRQFCVKLRYADDDDEKKWLRIHFTDIYHVDDPECSQFPKNEDAIAGLPDSQRSNKNKSAGKKQEKKPEPAAKF